MDKPEYITRQEAEKVVRSVIARHAGEKLPDNLFKDSVDALMEEINGKEVN